MEVTIIGVRNVSFTTKEGVFIEGQTIWYTTPIDKNGRGFQADKAFISLPKKINPSDLPCAADIYYNKFGKVDSVSLY